MVAQKEANAGGNRHLVMAWQLIPYFSLAEAVAAMSELPQPDHRRRGRTKITRHARCTKRLRWCHTHRVLKHSRGGVSSRNVRLSFVYARARNVCVLMPSTAPAGCQGKYVSFSAAKHGIRF